MLLIFLSRCLMKHPLQQIHRQMALKIGSAPGAEDLIEKGGRLWGEESVQKREIYANLPSISPARNVVE